VYLITRVRLSVRATVPDVDVDSIRRVAEGKHTGPVSIALNGTQIVLDAELEQASSA